MFFISVIICLPICFISPIKYQPIIFISTIKWQSILFIGTFSVNHAFPLVQYDPDSSFYSGFCCFLSFVYKYSVCCCCFFSPTALSSHYNYFEVGKLLTRVSFKPISITILKKSGIHFFFFQCLKLFILLWFCSVCQMPHYVIYQLEMVVPRDD